MAGMIEPDCWNRNQSPVFRLVVETGCRYLGNAIPLTV